MSKYSNFIIKKDNTFVFFDINNNTDVPSLSFYFGTANPMEMNFKTLGKIIAIAKWKTIPIWAMAENNDGNYHANLAEDIVVSHIDSESFFEMNDDIEVDFKKYDVLISNSDFKHQKDLK